ncbi:MAG: hypothetical protein P8Y11_12215 [Gemmatimonadales bacterium]
MYIRTDRGLAALLSLVFLAGCDQAPLTAPPASPDPNFSAESEWITDNFSFSFPFYLDCLDETVTWSGQGVVEAHLVTNPDGSVQENGKVSLAPGSTMVGPSGTWADPMVVNHYNADNGQGNLHVNERITWTNQATGAIMDVHTKVHIVLTGDGQVKVVQDTGGATCALR